jgi:hypothetical protein
MAAPKHSHPAQAGPHIITAADPVHDAARHSFMGVRVITFRGDARRTHASSNPQICGSGE